LEEHERYKIKEIGEDGEPIAPATHAKKFVSQCRVVVRDNIPITIREWKKRKTEAVSFVEKRFKYMLWKKLMVNFTLASPEVDPNEEDPYEEDPDLNNIERKDKKWTLSNMTTQFNNRKKRLDKDYVQKEKTPVFVGAFDKIKDHWDAFVEYKTSEEAKKRSVINKKNAAKKKYGHTMGQGGYKAGKPKWKKMKDGLIAKGINPEILKWNDRARDWFYGHGGTLDSGGKCIYTKNMTNNPFPLMPLEV
jgi:hypothetical protein